MRNIGGGGEQQSRLIYELCVLLLTILSPPPPPSQPRRRQAPPSPAAVASLLLGASMSLMLCGSVTFMIGFFLMPWVVGLVMLFGFLGFVSNLSGVGRAFLSCGASVDVPQGQLFSKLPN